MPITRVTRLGVTEQQGGIRETTVRGIGYCHCRDAEEQEGRTSRKRSANAKICRQKLDEFAGGRGASVEGVQRKGHTKVTKSGVG